MCLLECFFFYRKCPKRLLWWRNSRYFFRWSPVCSPKNASPLFLFLYLVPALAKCFSYKVFFPFCCTQPSQLQPISFCLYFTEISHESSMESKINGFILCFLHSVKWWKDLVQSYLSIRKVKLKLITTIRNAGLQLPGFMVFLISHQEMTQGCTILHRASIAFPKDTNLAVLRGLCFSVFTHTNTKMRHFRYRAVLLFERKSTMRR